MNMDNIGAGNRTSVWAQVPPQTMLWGTPAKQLANVMRKRKLDQQIVLTLPTEANSQRPSIFDSVFNVNMNMDNIGAGNRTSVWAQVPPQTMPWGTPAKQLANVMRFTGDLYSTTSSSSLSHPSEDSMSQSYYKRKASDFEPGISKMLVTEEMMTEQLKNMYIGNKMEKPNGNKEAIGEMMTEINNDQELPVLSVCSEIKHMIPVFKPPAPLPTTLLKNVKMPTKALVLWKPPILVWGDFLQESAASHNTSSSEHDSCTSSESKRKQVETIYAMDD